MDFFFGNGLLFEKSRKVTHGTRLAPDLSGFRCVWHVSGIASSPLESPIYHIDNIIHHCSIYG